MADPYAGLGQPVNAQAAPEQGPTDSITPEDYFSQVQKIYPNATYNGGGRTYARNLAVGGAPHSMHLTDQAMDFNVPGVDSATVFQSLKDNGLPVTESLNEGKIGSQGAHLHVGWAPKGQAAAPANSDPYAGVGTAVNPSAPHPADPYGGIGTPVAQQPQAPKPAGPQAAPGLMEQAGNIAGQAASYVGQEWNSQIAQPFEKTMGNITAPHGPNHQIPVPSLNNPLDFAKAEYDQAKKNLGFGADAASEVMGAVPVNLALHAGVVRPAASALSNIPMPTLPGQTPLNQDQREQKLEGMINTSLMGVGAKEGINKIAAAGMDAATDLKANYDFQQDLQSKGLPNSSPFVADMFKNRGMDTTPGSDPRLTQQFKSPMTGERVQLDANDQAQYQELLKTGDVDDIHKFFDGRQGPAPSYADINSWVSHRDLAPENVQDTHLQPDYDMAAQQAAQLHDEHMQAVTDHVNNITSDWKNAPDFEVIHNPSDIQDPTIRAQAQKEDVNGDALGFLGSDGKVRIFGSRITDPDTMNSVIYHEALGHYGLAQAFGDKLDSTIGTLLDRNVSQFGRDTDDWMEKHPGAYGGNRIRAAEEVLAEASENGTKKPTWSDALSATVRQFGRKMGLKLSYSDGEVNQILAIAHDAVVKGKGRDASANGYRTGQPPLNLESSKFKRSATGEEQTDPALLDHIDQLKQDPRFWSDPDFRKNVIEMARTRNPVDTSPREAAPKLRTEAEYKAQQVQPDIQSDNRYMFAGPKSKISDPYAIQEAKDRLANGDDPNEVRGLTGVHIAADGNLRTEISDDGAKISNKLATKGTYKLGDILQHDRLFDAYPDLKDVDVVSRPLKTADGMYDPKTNRIYVDPKGGRDYTRQVLLHEVQHAIQAHEEYPGMDANTVGMSAEDYRANPLEQEAHATEARRDMSGMDRRGGETPKFITQRQLDIHRATTKDYVSDDMERVYHSLNENFSKETIDWDQTRTAALENGISPSALKDTKSVEAGELAAKMWRVGAATNLADAKLKALGERLDTPNWSMGDKAEYLKTLADFNYLVARTKGLSSELGRAMNAVKAFRSYTNGSMSEVAEKLAESGSGLGHLSDDEEFLKFARSLKALQASGNPKAVAIKMAAVNKPYWWQYLNTVHMNMMLSALSTHVKAPMDMSTGIARDTIERVIAMPFGALRQLVQPGSGVRVGLPEIIADINGTIKAVATAEVWRAAGHAVRTGEGSYVDATGKRVPSNFANQFGSISNPRIPVASIPTDLITGQDTVYRSISMIKQLHALGTREAQERLGPKAPMDQVLTMGDSLARNPTATMNKQAHDITDRTLMMNSNGFNNMLDKIKSTRPGMNAYQQAASAIVSNLAPFIRVGANNLFNRVLSRSPLFFLDPTTMGELKAGGARQDIALARIAYGTTLMGMYWAMSGKHQDKITGSGPDDVNKYKELQAGGDIPRSIHENGRYNTSDSLAMSVNPFDVHNATATMIAAAHEAVDKGMTDGAGVAMKLGLGSIMHTLASMSWVNDMKGPVDALFAEGNDAGAKVNAAIGSEAKTWIPGGLSQAARLTDPYQHVTTDPNSITNTVVNEAKSAIPGLSQSLPNKISVYGDKLPNGASLTGVHTIIPGLEGNGQATPTDPTKIELSRLAKLSPAAMITGVQRTVQKDGEPLKLSPQKYQEYQETAGKMIVEQARDMMQTPEYQQASDKDKISMLHDLQKDAKSDARYKLGYD